MTTTLLIADIAPIEKKYFESDKKFGMTSQVEKSSPVSSRVASHCNNYITANLAWYEN